MRYAVGIDIGGTRIKAAAFDCKTDAVLSRDMTETRDGEQEDGRPAFAWEAERLLRKFERELGSGPACIGVSAPGLADRESTFIRLMPGRLDGLEGFVWGEFFGRPTTVLNDAHAAIWGEIWQGAARGVDDVFMLTLGTGVGGAAVSAGRLLRGNIGRAGHLGHISLNFESVSDICGTPGSLEALIGNATVGDRSGGRFPSTRELLEAVRGNDSAAEEVWFRSVKALAAGVASLINVLDPEVVLVGGGIAEAGACLFDPLEKYLDQFEWRPAGHRVEVRAAELGEWAGCYGAAWTALKEVDR